MPAGEGAAAPEALVAPAAPPPAGAPPEAGAAGASAPLSVRRPGSRSASRSERDIEADACTTPRAMALRTRASVFSRFTCERNWLTSATAYSADTCRWARSPSPVRTEPSTPGRMGVAVSADSIALASVSCRLATRGQNSLRSSTCRFTSNTTISPTGYGQKGSRPGESCSSPGVPWMRPKMVLTPVYPSCTVWKPLKKKVISRPRMATWSTRKLSLSASARLWFAGSIASRRPACPPAAPRTSKRALASLRCSSWPGSWGSRSFDWSSGGVGVM